MTDYFVSFICVLNDGNLYNKYIKYTYFYLFVKTTSFFNLFLYVNYLYYIHNLSIGSIVVRKR